MSDTLTALDATFLELEQKDEGALMGIGGVSVFDPVPGDGEPTVEALGNWISSLFVDLPVGERVAHLRHRKIMAATERLKSAGAATGAEAMLDLAALAPPIVHATLARSLYATRLFNVTITNVPGPQVPLYAMGAKLREVHPVVPLAAEHSVGIAIFSYDGTVTFGVIADSESTPDLDVLEHGIEEGIDELLELVPL